MNRKVLLLFQISMIFLLSMCTREKLSYDQPPEWASHAIWYQIFVERFHNGDTGNDPKPENILTASDFYKIPDNWGMTPWTGDWYREDSYANNLDGDFYSKLQLRRYGGDLQGVLNRLDYLQDLGITAIYFNPINDAPSLHKYDARNYRHVDVNFGPDPEGDNEIIASEDPSDPSTWKWTSADKMFLELVKELHKRGIRIIMDYSWNHTGVEFWAWKDLVKNQQNSGFKDWYDVVSFDDLKTPENEFDYHGWLNLRSLPELKKVNITTERKIGYPYEGELNDGAKQHIFEVSRRWLAPDGKVKDGIDGYRLDVADHLPMDFWRDYRSFVKSINPEAYLVGEIWWREWPDKLMDPEPYLRGDIFDAVMHYQIYRPARSFFGKMDQSINAKAFKDSLETQWGRLSRPYRYAMMNVAATHDSPRLLSSFYNPTNYKFRAKPSDNPEYKSGKPDAETYDRVKLYLVHQFTNIGAPHIWNGDEMGMWGCDDPDCRKPLWWEELDFEPESRNNFQDSEPEYDPVGFNPDLHAFYKKMIRMRNENEVLRTGDIKFLLAENNMLSYLRFNENDEILVLFNLDEEEESFKLPEGTTWKNLLHDTDTVNGEINLDPMSAVVLEKDRKNN